jgi:hypothetical protein
MPARIATRSVAGGQRPSESSLRFLNQALKHSSMKDNQVKTVLPGKGDQKQVKV